MYKRQSLPAIATVGVSLTDDNVGTRGPRTRPLRLEWMTYRGPAPVAFSPVRSDAPGPTGGKITTTAKFTAPGSYTIRASATDIGGLSSYKDVVLQVK